MELFISTPEESIFVDDKKENTKGAKKSGFKKAYHLTNENEIIEKSNNDKVYNDEGNGKNHGS